MAASKRRAAPRSYARLDRQERNAIERLLDRGKTCREAARELGRAPSTVASWCAIRIGPNEHRNLSAACIRN